MTKVNTGWNLEETYTSLPEIFYSKINPNPVRSPELVIVNERLAGKLGLDGEKLKEKENFISKRKGIIKFNELSLEEKNKLIKENPSYGKIICKCELITEGEVRDAINRPLGATTVDGVKRRTRVTMGGCQGTGCLIPIVKLIKEELDLNIDKVFKDKEGSVVLGYKEVQ